MLVLLGLLLAVLSTLLILTLALARWLFRRWHQADPRRMRVKSTPESPWQIAGRRVKPIEPDEAGPPAGGEGARDA